RGAATRPSPATRSPGDDQRPTAGSPLHRVGGEQADPLVGRVRLGGQFRSGPLRPAPARLTGGRLGLGRGRLGGAVLPRVGRGGGGGGGPGRGGGVRGGAAPPPGGGPAPGGGRRAPPTGPRRARAGRAWLRWPPAHS